MADFQTKIIKFDMGLIRNIHQDKSRQIIVRNCFSMFRELNIISLAEGIETIEEMKFMQDLGIELMQGYFFAKPEFECLPKVDFRLFKPVD